MGQPSILDLVNTADAEIVRNLEQRLGGQPPARHTAGYLLNAAESIDQAGFPARFLDAAADQQIFERLAAAYDEKEGCLRIPIWNGAGLTVRLHVWLPPRPGFGPYLENIHSHRRYMSSSLLLGGYASDEYEADGGALTFNGRRILSRGTCYLIAPQTVHAVANPFAEHCVSLILRGDAITDKILIFDRDASQATAYADARPVGDLGKNADEQAMSRAEYLGYRLGLIRVERGDAGPHLPVSRAG